MKLHFATLDAFTTTPYTGNPVAIVRVPADKASQLTQVQKQSIASEFNLSETVFLHLPAEGASYKEIHIDIFTCHAEIPFAGHPTIGTSAYLLNILGERTETLITKAGPIPISKDETTGKVKAVIPQDFHVHAATFKADYVLPNKEQENEVASIVKGMSFILVPLPSLSHLSLANRNLNIDTYNTSPLDAGWQTGLIATMYFVAQGEDEFGRKKYRTRMFGTREDPGTGSASSALGCYLAGKEGGEGVFRYAFEQGVEMGRRNEISVEVKRKGEGNGVERVVLSGNAVKVMEGSLEV